VVCYAGVCIQTVYIKGKLIVLWA